MVASTLADDDLLAVLGRSGGSDGEDVEAHTRLRFLAGGRPARGAPRGGAAARQPDVVLVGRRAPALHPHERPQEVAQVRADPRLAVSILDPENPYRFLEIGELRDRSERVILVARPTAFRRHP